MKISNQLFSHFRTAAFVTAGALMIYDVTTAEPPEPPPAQPVAQKVDSTVTGTQRAQLLAQHPALQESLGTLGIATSRQPDRSLQLANYDFEAANDTYRLNCDDLPQNWAESLRTLFTARADNVVTLGATTDQPVATTIITDQHLFSVVKTAYKPAAFQKTWLESPAASDIKGVYGITLSCN